MPAYASAAAPTVARRRRALAARGRHRIAVASYFTAPGRFATQCAEAAPWIAAAPLGAHPAMARLVLHRYDQALAAPAPATRHWRRPSRGAATARQPHAACTRDEQSPQSRRRTHTPQLSVPAVTVDHGRHRRHRHPHAPTPQPHGHAHARQHGPTATRRPRALGARAGQTARPHRLPARPRAGAALRRAAPARRQDPGGRPRHRAASAWDASPRTRLTHSLECAQVGRELGAALGCDPDLVEAACLAHDLGHPPFGHNGEQALNEFAAGLRRLRGQRPVAAAADPDRAQAVRRGRRTGTRGELVSVGLNLTRAALDAATKYPWPRGGHPTDPGSPKFGVYEDDLPVFDWVRAGRPAAPHVLRGPGHGLVRRRRVLGARRRGRPARRPHRPQPACSPNPSAREIFGGRRRPLRPPRTPTRHELAEALDRLLDQEWWPHGYDGSAVAQARLKDATSQLIGRFCLAAEGATRARVRHRPAHPVRAPNWSSRARPRLECAVLKAVADRYVMQRAEQERAPRRPARSSSPNWPRRCTARAPEGLDPQFRALFDAAPDDRARKRVDRRPDRLPHRRLGPLPARPDSRHA